AWDCLQSRLKREWQAHNWTMNIELRDGLPARDKGGDAIEAFHQSHEFWLDLEHNTRAQCGEQRHITADHQRVTEPLLGMNKDCLSIYRAVTHPHRSTEIPVKIQIFRHLQSKLIFLPTSFHVS